MEKTVGRNKETRVSSQARRAEEVSPRSLRSQLQVEIIQFVSACSGEGILPRRAMKRRLEFLLTAMIGA